MNRGIFEAIFLKTKKTQISSALDILAAFTVIQSIGNNSSMVCGKWDASFDFCCEYIDKLWRNWTFLAVNNIGLNRFLELLQSVVKRGRPLIGIVQIIQIVVWV